jgi:uncharacterized protein YajQ (UPF0234 family)
MNLLLFERGGEDFFVTGERKHHRPESEGADQGTLKRIKHRVRSAYEKIRHKFDYQENVCSTMRHAESLTLVHPESLNAGDVETRFRSFLVFRGQKHKRWMIIDGVLALFGSLLTPIPGPNVFFLYPAVRSLSHYLALRGVRRAQKLKMLSFKAELVIDRIQLNLERLDSVESEIRELEHRFDLRDLKSLLSK